MNENNHTTPQSENNAANNSVTNNNQTFANLKLSSNIIRALEDKGYKTPSPIQSKAIPVVLKGQDILAAAQTGTGKTASFTLPILDNLSKGHPARSNEVRALIITPTRELAAQVFDNTQMYSKYLSIKSAVVFGGVSINPQMKNLRRGVDVLIATPGRLLDLYQQNAIKFNRLEILVLDEADRMLDMGFIHDIKKVINLLPKQRQNLMFSATFSDDIRQLAKTIVRHPVEVSTAPKNTTVKAIQQLIHPVDKKRKPELLIHLIKEHNWHQVLVFSRTKHGANKLTQLLDKAKIKAAAIHGNKSQGARTKALADFKSGKVNVLVATDIAARGIDIDSLPYVVNIDLPNVPEDYVHRIGRTGRAGASGLAVSLVSADEIKQLQDIEQVIQNLLPRDHVQGFVPDHDVPPTTLRKPKKAAVKKSSGHSHGRSEEKPKRQRVNNDSSNAKNTASRNKPRGDSSKGSKNGNTRSGNASNKPRFNNSAKKNITVESSTSKAIPP